MANRSPKARTTVFLLAGGGGGNGVEFASIAADSETTVATFTHTWGDEPDDFSPAVELNTHKVLFGFSVFFG